MCISIHFFCITIHIFKYEYYQMMNYSKDVIDYGVGVVTQQVKHHQ